MSIILDVVHQLLFDKFGGSWITVASTVGVGIAIVVIVIVVLGSGVEDGYLLGDQG